MNTVCKLKLTEVWLFVLLLLNSCFCFSCVLVLVFFGGAEIT